MTIPEMSALIWIAGGIHTAIVVTNFFLPHKLQVQRNLGDAPRFLKQIFYVHWFYIVVIVALFAVLCFRFAPELAGGSQLGRFLSAFIAGFWFCRALLQWFYYDPQLLRESAWLRVAYSVALIALTSIFGVAAIHPAH